MFTNVERFKANHNYIAHCFCTCTCSYCEINTIKKSINQLGYKNLS